MLQPPNTEPKSALRFVLPLGIFAVLAGFLFVGLGLNPREVPSPFIGKPAPSFQLTQLAQPEQTFSPQQMQGRSVAAQCMGVVVRRVPHRAPAAGRSGKERCDSDHRIELQGQARRCVGLARADSGTRTNCRSSIPTAASASTMASTACRKRSVIDKAGVIRFKQIGPITEDAWRTKILPLVQQLRQS